MEAMWMRFIPAMRKTVEFIKSGELGDIQMISASLGFYNEIDSEHRLFNPDLGGGALLDLGVYPLSFIMQILGRPSTISSKAIIGETNVDEYAAVLFGFPGGQIAQLTTNIRATQRNDAYIIGTSGTMLVHAPLYRPTKLTLSRNSSPIGELSQNNELIARLKENKAARSAYRQWKRFSSLLQGTQNLKINCDGNGYGYEITEVGQCLRASNIESKIMPLVETLAIMETMDNIRQQWPIEETSFK